MLTRRDICKALGWVSVMNGALILLNLVIGVLSLVGGSLWGWLNIGAVIFVLVMGYLTFSQRLRARLRDKLVYDMKIAGQEATDAVYAPHPEYVAATEKWDHAIEEVLRLIRVPLHSPHYVYTKWGAR